MEYIKAKQSAAEQFPFAGTSPDYTDAKGPVVGDIEDRAARWAVRAGWTLPGSDA